LLNAFVDKGIRGCKLFICPQAKLIKNPLTKQLVLFYFHFEYRAVVSFRAKRGTCVTLYCQVPRFARNDTIVWFSGLFNAGVHPNEEMNILNVFINYMNWPKKPETYFANILLMTKSSANLKPETL